MQKLKSRLEEEIERRSCSTGTMSDWERSWEKEIRGLIALLEFSEQSSNAMGIL